MDIDIDTTQLIQMATRYAGAAPVVANEVKLAMTKSVLAVEASAKKVVVVDTGNLRRSITHEVQVGGGMVVGKVGSNVPYAKVVEEGRTPGLMPPQGALLGWMGRHGIPAESEYVIRRAINRRKIARPYLKPAITANAAAIDREFAAVIGRVMKKIGAGS